MMFQEDMPLVELLELQAFVRHIAKTGLPAPLRASRTIRKIEILF